MTALNTLAALVVLDFSDANVGVFCDHLEEIGHEKAAECRDNKYVAQRFAKTIILPVVGMGVTGGAGSDCYPFTVVEVRSETTMVIQSDDYRLISGSTLSENQEYAYTSNPQGAKIVVTRRNNGRWVRKGEPKTGSSFAIGFRRAYQDPSF